jgi:uncharacterized ferritin-like protein (DUF455 family)
MNHPLQPAPIRQALSLPHPPLMECRQLALDALCLRDPAAKVAAVHDLWARIDTMALHTDTPLQPLAHAVPGRPDRPPLRSAKAVPTRSVFTPQGMAAMVHAVCHIEFNAINLALDAVWRYAGMPAAYYLDWLRVAHEEATHFGLLQAHLQAHGHAYGDFDAHDGLWAMCEKTAADVLARMALVPRTLEARGLDATPLIQAKLQRANTPQALTVVGILDIILRDEVGHVAIGNHWYRWLCAQRGLDPEAFYPSLVAQYDAPHLKPPFNDAARLQAGFSAQELAALHQAATRA